MCGICGYLTRAPMPHEALKAATNSLIHRGPDDVGYYFSQDSCLGLGHRRLSIIDLSPKGRQPMANEGKTIWVSFNGEIYNYLELRERLLAKGHRFKSQTDTEVIVHGYEEWGTDCFSELNGMFAIAIWDEAKQKLILARDRIGQKPLFYHSHNGNFCFASELKALMKLPFFEKEIDFESLKQYLVFNYVPAPRSIFRHTFKLEPGKLLVVSKKTGTIRLETYWDPIPVLRNKRHNNILSEEAYLDQLEQLLVDAVRKRLISDVPLGAFLSGGIDSSLIVAIMTELSDLPVKTFTIGFEELEYNEAVYAKRVAEYLRTEHREFYLSSRDSLDIIEKLPDMYDEPFADHSAIPTYLVSKHTREYVTVALSGDGGDELFCGYPRYDWILGKSCFTSLPRALRKLVSNGIRRLLPSSRRISTLEEALAFKDLSDLYLFSFSSFKQRDLQKLVEDRYDPEAVRFHQVYNMLNDEDILDVFPMIDLTTYLPGDILTKVDRASMFTSLEARAPLLDYRVVEFAISLPVELKRKNGDKKYLLKELLYKYLPKELFLRPKHGFGIPLSFWLRDKGGLRPLVEEYLNPERIEKEGTFNADFISRLVASHLDGDESHQNRLWALLMLQMWAERYDVELPQWNGR